MTPKFTRLFGSVESMEEFNLRAVEFGRNPSYLASVRLGLKHSLFWMPALLLSCLWNCACTVLLGLLVGLAGLTLIVLTRTVLLIAALAGFLRPRTHTP